MNILIPHSWLLEHLETQATPQEIQKYLSLSGPSVERIYEREGEPVYDIEVTTNRVDSMSVRGIAREAAVILTEAGLPSKLKEQRVSASFRQPAEQDHARFQLPVIHNDPRLCKRIMCVVIADVQKVQSPEWMQKRLRQVGINTHDSVIDISNYITHELGHPCHTFDYDKIMNLGGVIHVREAQRGKKFSIIDGTEYETVGGEVVFENDADEIIDLPAIKGTKNTSIADDTKNVLLWIESLDAKKVRFASMTHSIRTVAAQLNEKNVDPNLGSVTLERGSALLCELAGGSVASEIHDEYPGERTLPTINFQLSMINQYLGIEISRERVIHILQSLECVVQREGESLLITPPSFRPDLEIAADIVEEIARIHGYHNLPSTLMRTAIPTERPADTDFETEHAVKEFLATLGAYEVYTYSMIDEATKEIEARWIGTEADTHLKLANPLTDDMVYLRRTLWASHLNVLAQNPIHKEIAIFEMANTYIPVASGREIDRKLRSQKSAKDRESTVLPYEEFHLTITARMEERQVKGMLEAVCKKYFLPTLRYVPNGSVTSIFAGDTQIGYYMQPSALSAQYSVLDMDWRTFLSLRRKYPQYKAESKFTPVTEDLTFTVPTDVHIQRLLETIGGVPSVSTVSLKDIYQRNFTVSLSYESDHQLEGSEVSAIRTAVIKAVESAHHASLVGKITVAENVSVKESVKIELTEKKEPVQTEAIYLLDSYAKEMDAVVKAVEAEGKNRWKVYLDRTVFYPMGGGQPTDQGTLISEGWTGSVYQVQYKQGEIVHYVESVTPPSIGSTVHGSIDWERRYRHMQIHSAGHIVDYAMYILGYSPKQLVPTKGEHGKKPYILYTGSLFKDIKEELTAKANEIVAKNMSLVTTMTTLEELKKTAIYLQPGLPTGKPLRMLTLEGVGSVADGGTQVMKTSEVGRISITDIVVKDGTTTVFYFV